MTTGHRLGELGEQTACLFLQMCGFNVLEVRFRVPGGEIDLVMARGSMVIFVEVKTRGPGAAARPEECVTRRQRGKLRRAASAWLTANDAWDRPVRFDVVAVQFEGPDRGLEVRHYADADGFAK